MDTLKNYLFIIIASFIFCLGAEAQDILVKKDGSALQIKTEEISETTIKYRLWDDQSGPLRSISIESVLSINYANGRIEKFNSNATPNAAEQPVQVMPQTTVPLQNTDEAVKPTSVTIPRGTIIPIYNDFTINSKSLAKEGCLAYVGEDVIIDDCIVISKGSEVYGTGKGNGFSWGPKSELRLLYIITSKGALIPIEGMLHIKLPIVTPAKIHIKESESTCTVKEDVTILLAD